MNLGFLNKRQGLLELSMGYSQPTATQHFVRKPKKMAALEHPNLIPGRLKAGGLDWALKPGLTSP